MKFFNYEDFSLKDVFNDFFCNVKIDEKIQDRFFKEDFNKIIDFLNKSNNLNLSNFPFEIFASSSICTCYNFYNSFIIKFGNFSVQKYLNTKKNENIFFKEHDEIKPITTYNIKIPMIERFENELMINDYKDENDNNKFILQEIDCMIIQPFIISILELDKIKNNLCKIINEANLLRELETEVDLNPSNIGLYNGSLYLMDW